MIISGMGSRRTFGTLSSRTFLTSIGHHCNAYEAVSDAVVFASNRTASRLTIAQSLYNILLEETPHTWSAADLSQAGTDFQKGPMTSVFITADGKHRRLEQTSGADKGTGVGAGGGYGGHQPPPRPPSGDPDGPSGGQGTPPQPLDVSQATIAAKLIGEIAKIVTNDQKYDGTNGSFNQKQTIFHDICRRVEFRKKQ